MGSGIWLPLTLAHVVPGGRKLRGVTMFSRLLGHLIPEDLLEETPLSCLLG